MIAMRSSMRWWLVATMAFTACGSGGTSVDAGSNPGVGSGADPGSGTKTLYAGIELELAALAGGGSATAELTVVLARAMLGGPSVSGAIVTLTAPDGVSVTATEDPQTPGSYVASGFVWEPSWHVQISAGSDQLQLTVAAPGATTITSPAQGATVAVGSVALQWTDAWGAKAQSIWAECCGDPTVKLTDSGSGTVTVDAPGGEVTLYRQNALVPSGGAAGSLATAETSYGIYLQTQTTTAAALPALCQPRPDPSSAGCFADEPLTICGPDACQNACDGSNVSITCVGNGPLGTVPQPDPAAGCTGIVIPTPPNELFYCCPCGAP